MKTFNNLAGFKRHLGIGVELHAVQHTAFAGREPDTGRVIYKDQDMGVRPVSIVQSNSFACKTEKSDGKVVDSWCGYPKASECRIENNTLTILEEDMRGPDPTHEMIPVLSYKFV